MVVPIQVFFPVSVESTLLFFLFSLFFSVLTFVKRTFSLNGIIFGNFVGLLVFLLGGIQSFFVLVVFFVLGEFATVYSRSKTKVKHETRNSFNVFGNTVAPLLFLFFGQTTSFFGGISAALSDTLSSEIGLLSKKKPMLITTFKEVKAGTNGGVSFLGTAVSFFGAIVCAGIYFLFFHNALLAFFVFVAGIVGSITDSLLGALFENKGKLDKTQVNFFATLSGALVVLILQALTSML